MAKQETPRGKKNTNNPRPSGTSAGNQTGNQTGKQTGNPTGSPANRPNRNNLWALLIVGAVLLIYVINGAFMPVVDPEDQRAWATATALAENGIPAQAAATQAAATQTAAAQPAAQPTDAASVPSPTPAEAASAPATEQPDEAAQEAPAESPTETPTESPTETPTATPQPTNTPTPAPTNTPTRQPTALPAQINGLPTILYADLPPQAHDTIALIDQNGPFPFDRDGITFQNRERLLPQEARNYYREYTVITPGINHRGARRIVTGAEGELYYTDDHYESFFYIVR